jgi:bile acid:Na+ symporter, BASS family
MYEILARALNPVILIFLVSTMLACGLSLTLRQIFGPFRNIRLAISAAVASYLLVPLTAVVVSRLIGLEVPLRYGLVLISMAAGAEAGPKLVTNAKGNIGLSVGLLVVSLGITIFYIPLMLSLLLPEVHVDKVKLLVKLCLTVALPIALGLFLKARVEGLADRLAKYVHKISSVFMFLMAVLIIILNYKEMFRLFGSGAIVAALIFIVVSFTIGYLLGWPDRGTRLAMAFMHGGRNASLALMIASQVFSDQPNVLMMITVTVVLMLVLLLPSSIYFGRRTARGRLESMNIEKSYGS